MVPLRPVSANGLSANRPKLTSDSVRLAELDTLIAWALPSNSPRARNSTNWRG